MVVILVSPVVIVLGTVISVVALLCVTLVIF